MMSGPRRNTASARTARARCASGRGPWTRAVRMAADAVSLYDPFNGEAVSLRDRVLFASPVAMLGAEYLSPGTGRAALSSMQGATAARDQEGRTVVYGMLSGQAAWVSDRGVHIAREGQHDVLRAARKLNATICF